VKIMRINWSGNIEPQFKLALVLGPSRVPGKQRVRVWLHAPGRWTNASAVRDGQLSPVDERELSPRHAAVLRAARKAATAAENPDPPSIDNKCPTCEAVPGEDCTEGRAGNMRLVPLHPFRTRAGLRLQELNRRMSGAMFGGGSGHRR
jgi:hypothetical protein